MPDPRELLVCLLDYIKEQTKEVDPKGYGLASSKGFLRNRGDLAGLPGVEFNIRLAGDHVWLRVPRLAAEPPPDPPKSYKSLLKVSSDPTGVLPYFDDAALTRLVNRAIQNLKSQGSPSDEEIARLETQHRGNAAQVSATYTVAWNSWAAAEQPRRLTISLYGDLFTLMHQMEAEQTSKPQELIWALGSRHGSLRLKKSEFLFSTRFSLRRWKLPSTIRRWRLIYTR